MKKLSAAVVGLGNVGSRFDEEPRGVVWSHTGAFVSLSSHFELVGGADISVENRSRFAERVPSVPVFDSATALMEICRPEVVSICTPPHGRSELVSELLGLHKPKAIICEKPMGLSAKERIKLFEVCAAADVLLAVNYNRRYDARYRQVRYAVEQGQIGDLISVTVTTPNRLWSIGSHAVNLMCYIVNDTVEEWAAIPLPGLFEDGEPAADVLVRFSGGVAGRLNTAGRRRELIFELEVIGTDGRIRCGDHHLDITIQSFEESSHFEGYRTLRPCEVLAAPVPVESTFLNIALEIHSAISNGGELVSDGQSAIASENLLDGVMKVCHGRNSFGT